MNLLKLVLRNGFLLGNGPKQDQMVVKKDEIADRWAVVVLDVAMKTK